MLAPYAKQEEQVPFFNALWACLAIYALILPVGGTTALRYTAFVLVIVFLGWQSWRARRWPELPIALPWLAYLLPALLSLTYAVDKAYSLGEIKAEILVPFLIVSVVSNIVRDEKAFLRLLAILTAGNVFLVAFSLATSALGGETKDGLVGTFNTGVGYYSTYLVAVIPFLCLLAARQDRKTKVFLVLAILLAANLASLFLTGNRQGFVALLAEILVAGFFLRRGISRKSWLQIGSLCAVIMILFLFQYTHRHLSQGGSHSSTLGGDIRWPIWIMCLRELAEAPWTGGGFGLRVFQFVYPDIASQGPFWHAHNTLLNKAVQMGVPGVVGFLILFFSVPWRMGVFRRGASGLRKAALIAGLAMTAGIFIKNMTDDFFYRESGYMFWLLAGAVLGFLHGEKEMKETDR